MNADENKQDTKQQSQSLSHAFSCAGHGVVLAIKERNMRIHVCFACAALFLCLILRVDAPSWLAVVICICLVFSLETLNTALEAVTDLASPEYHELAKIAKDCAAGAVLISAIGSLVVAAIVFLPRIFALLF